jgi:hypothetical protein
MVQVRGRLITSAEEWFNQAADERYRQQNYWGSKNPQEGYVYVIEDRGLYKIGRSRDPDDRVGFLGIKFPYPVKEIARLYTVDMRGAERLLHKEFAAKRLGGEWFELDAEDVGLISLLAEEVERREQEQSAFRGVPPGEDPDEWNQTQDGTWYRKGWGPPEREPYYVLGVLFDWE